MTGASLGSTGTTSTIAFMMTLRRGGPGAADGAAQLVWITGAADVRLNDHGGFLAAAATGAPLGLSDNSRAAAW